MGENRGDGLGEYVRQVRETTQRYARDLLVENEKLMSRLVEEVEALREQLERQRTIESSLLARIGQVETVNREFADRFVDVEIANSNLANLYVASYRLQGSHDRKEVVANIHEVLVNLVGSEQFAILERTPDGRAFEVTSSLGLDEKRCAALRGDAGRIGEALRTRATYVVAEGDQAVTPAEADLTACVPLEADGVTIAGIAVFRLLGHKAGLTAVDHELFALLATHAANALHCSNLRARMAELETARVA
jgi:hypothetical protein